MTTYDLHQHLWPEEFIAVLRSRDAPPRLTDDVLETREGRFPIDLRDHEVATRIALLDRDGVDVAILSLQPSLGLDAVPGDERSELEDAWAAGALAAIGRSSGRIAAFSPSVVRPGFAGVSLGSGALHDLDLIAPTLDAASDAGVAVFVHPDAGPGADDRRPEWLDWVAGYPARMQEAYVAWLAEGRRRWPTLKVLFAMLAGGGPFQLERLARRGLDVRSALDPNTFFDVSTYGRRAIELCVETFGVEQLAYGSDTPVVDSRPTLDAVRGFGDAVTYVLQSETPSRILT